MADANGNRTHAPYNFVPFVNNILTPVSGRDELTENAGHDKIRPERHTGEIRVTLEADTPVFVGDGDKADPRFFRDAQGRFCIPGSTVRGLLRQNMKILGFGLVRAGEDVENHRLYFREMAAKKGTVEEKLSNDYKNALGVKTGVSPKTGKPYSKPEKVRSGWLENRGGEYRILPTAEPYLRVSRDDERVQRVQRFRGLEAELFARTISVAYQSPDGKRVTELLPIEEKHPGMKEGKLLYTGHWVKNPNCLYLFPCETAEAEAFALSEEDALAYQEDYENRENGLRGNSWHIHYDLDFWKLPEDGKRKPVFYIWDEEHCIRYEGHGIRYEGHCYFGMTLFPRIGYRWTIADGLPEGHRAAAEEGALDYTDILLGYARNDPLTGKNEAFASRVSVGDFPAVGNPAEMDAVRLMLASPKPGYYPGYLETRTDEKSKTQICGTYNDTSGKPDFRLRGYKGYWLKSAQTPDGSGNKNMESVLRPLGKGTKFRGVIRFENLTKEELGLVLWCLRLKRESDEKETYYQSVGMGKPYGYGRMKVTLERVLEFDAEAMYRPDGQDALAGLFRAPRELDAGTIDGYVAAYDNSALRALQEAGGGADSDGKKRSLRDYPVIRNFLYMKRAIRSGQDCAYMEIRKKVEGQKKPVNEYRDNRAPLPTAAESASKDMRSKNTPPKPKDAPPKPKDAPPKDMETLLRQLSMKSTSVQAAKPAQNMKKRKRR